jgi:hypothetical protein
MSDEAPGSKDPVGAAALAPERKRRWKWPLIIGGLVIGLPTIVFVAWSLFALSWTYSAGDRAGYVQKFSKKGWVCKTWEGELSMINIPGAAPERWQFTVRDDSVAQVISSLMGKQVALTYEEHPGVPSSCFGETRYYVTGAKRVP